MKPFNTVWFGLCYSSTNNFPIPTSYYGVIYIVREGLQKFAACLTILDYHLLTIDKPVSTKNGSGREIWLFYFLFHLHSTAPNLALSKHELIHHMILSRSVNRDVARTANCSNLGVSRLWRNIERFGCRGPNSHPMMWAAREQWAQTGWLLLLSILSTTAYITTSENIFAQDIWCRGDVLES